MKTKFTLVLLVVVLLTAGLLASCQRSQPEWETNTRAGGSSQLEVRRINVLNQFTNEGASQFDGAVTVDGAAEFNSTVQLDGGNTVNNWMKIAAPTAVATATPAFVIDSAGVSVLLDVRKQATPVFTVGNIGSVTGLSLDTSSFISVGSFLALEAAVTIPVVDGATITPLGSLQPITSTAPVTTSTSTAVASGGRTGDLLILRNANASDAITIDGAGGNVECGGNVALGANDVLTLMWNGADWSCLSLRDN